VLLLPLAGLAKLGRVKAPGIIDSDYKGKIMNMEIAIHGGVEMMRTC